MRARVVKRAVPEGGIVVDGGEDDGLRDAAGGGAGLLGPGLEVDAPPRRRRPDRGR